MGSGQGGPQLPCFASQHCSTACSHEGGEMYLLEEKLSLKNVVLIFCPVNKAQNPAVTGTLVALASLFSM